MNLPTLLILGLATWRISSMIVQEAGPFHIFTKLREKTGIIHDPDEEILQIPDRFFAGIFSCVWCCSIYLGIFWTVAWLLWPGMVYLALPFALSALAILANVISGRGK
jgi:hypothetical protein